MEASVQFPAASDRPSAEASLSSVFAATLWLSCVVVAVVGSAIPYTRPAAPSKIEPVIQAQRVQIDLAPANAEPVQNVDRPLAETVPPPVILKAAAAPGAPALTPVAAPSPAIAFAVPVTGAVRIVEAKAAATAAPAHVEEPVAAAQPAVATLTFGVGEGRQPAPEYPRRALQERQEGIVRILFTVGTDGRPMAAEVTQASPWPLLNNAALKVVRERWRFAPGAVRRYEAPINFQIRK